MRILFRPNANAIINIIEMFRYSEKLKCVSFVKIDDVIRWRRWMHFQWNGVVWREMKVHKYMGLLAANSEHTHSNAHESLKINAFCLKIALKCVIFVPVATCAA